MGSSSTPLPIEPLLPELIETLKQHGRLVLQAPPGAGKTTRVPLALAQQLPWSSGKVLVLEPRRLAAKMAARQMARSLGEAVGDPVGYRVRLDSCVGPNTRVELLTDGLFLRLLLGGYFFLCLLSGCLFQCLLLDRNSLQRLLNIFELRHELSLVLDETLWSCIDQR